MRTPWKTAAVAVTIASSFTLGAVAQAAGGWRVFATGSDSSEYGAYTSANADVLRPQALAVRMSKAGKLSWSLSCDSDDNKVQANQVVAVTVAGAKSCRLYGSASTESPGTLRVQLLKK